MALATALTERRTAVDDVYEHLHEQIATLKLKPGDRTRVWLETRN